ncbi:MAG TPA: phosphoethanolamine transferase [Pinirhizobacter sp.]|uniref:phosphoethanolamine transferase n=1 Tax=Pinirhizobacter sp. TaxID=2950432 RepID=UPI002CECDC14|nr:phosphoethanolamine transferase [Pinirhizobacter sp.]HMH67876.1 phosphoethanolamine transferase [Pinirhizobacter sp.]
MDGFSRKEGRVGSVAFLTILALAMLPTVSRTALGLLHGLPLWLTVLALINRRRAVAILLFPLVLCLPAVLYYQHAYRMAPGLSLWLILLDSSGSEVVEYLAGFALPLVIWITVATLTFITVVRRIDGPIFRHRTMRFACAASFLVPSIGMVGLGGSKGSLAESANRYFHNSFPWSVLAGRAQARRELALFAGAEREAAASSTVVAQKIDNTGGPRTVVLVIGESARRDRHGIFGYTTPTTRIVEGIDGVAAFSDAVTLHPYTVDAVPVIVARHDRLAPSAVRTPNLVSLFAAAGFRTSWISNQAAMGADDSLVSVYAKYADDRWFSRAVSRSGATSLDEDLLPRFRSELAATSDDKFIVMHLYGSHENFEKRYPASFAIFPDAYDNSIAYTDFILGQILIELQALPGRNGLLYVADHGLKLGECDGRSEHYDIKQAFEVPLYMWTSVSWREAYPQKWLHALSNRDAPVTTLYAFDTLVDMGGLTYPQYQAGMSLFSERPDASARKVHTFAGAVDYDHGANDAFCHLVPTPAVP